MDETSKMEALQSAAAFVEGGIQDACDDSCSICLESFCDSNPATVTSCKHEFHIQCILEWCQRSSQCPMCWQPISLKDSTSQELLEAVERERSIRVNQSHNTTIFHHPALGEFELQHLPVGATDSDLEERIIQHLAAAAAMRRAHHGARRGMRSGSPSQGRSQFLVFSTHPTAASLAALSASSANGGENESVSAISATDGQSVTATTEDRVQQQSFPTLPVAESRNNAASTNSPGLSNLYSLRENRTVGESTPISQDRAGPSDFQSFSDSLKSRLNAVSMRYKESISKSTRGWKERFFSRNTSMSDIGSEVRREVNAGIATVSRMMERIDMRENSSAATSGASTEHSVVESSNERVTGGSSNVNSNDTCPTTSCAASSGLN
ncbi:E3 ubiquitin-protein ligase RHF2A [Dendrobium catenatum]|uniref:RING-type E3 ubiquitin transferase n=1 Tax=Dendrobium catenatum TaxID=906689 RepID=A0A2I0X6M6_9ASPA|nr:E3 ubiquitin-protein ligase RHF2A [Dendrobium catenatum]XP_020692360.1 E3 ubiquitin-protein ligase RHF2A [Dendrobium catenatum]XP_020692366.1 E3 ubiquitin-protein ligase RHF2A [Dendrobium catenatum]XP_020692373.1 E3 ubiquitin-protein ligase RHF2A [Dendrobium catenatum]XP_028549254.1 E3 ubiquitin-protein ligase RHF2A [Dendrobium catenatum]PKU83567.1 E3 ubiquitin-protein ligase RHF2A [Dendrobium catenatum]